MPKKHRRYSLTLQQHNRMGYAIRVGDDLEALMSLANVLRRDFLKAGVRVTVYDIQRGENAYDYTVE